MKRDEATAVLKLPEEQAISIILELAEKAEKYDQLHEGVSPSTPSSMTPTYLKPNKTKKETGSETRTSGYIPANSQNDPLYQRAPT